MMSRDHHNSDIPDDRQIWKLRYTTLLIIIVTVNIYSRQVKQIQEDRVLWKSIERFLRVELAAITRKRRLEIQKYLFSSDKLDILHSFRKIHLNTRLCQTSLFRPQVNVVHSLGNVVTRHCCPFTRQCGFKWGQVSDELGPLGVTLLLISSVNSSFRRFNENTTWQDVCIQPAFSVIAPTQQGPMKTKQKLKKNSVSNIASLRLAFCWKWGHVTIFCRWLICRTGESFAFVYSGWVK